MHSDENAPNNAVGRVVGDLAVAIQRRIEQIDKEATRLQRANGADSVRGHNARIEGNGAVDALVWVLGRLVELHPASDDLRAL
jgi:hypothetical protein